MSEPDSGSDLASVRTRAERVDGGWRLTGTKVWTSGAHEADAFFALARTEPLDPVRRHDGLSQFIVDLRAPGVTIRPIISMGGDHHFNEVHLDGVFIPDDRVLGEVGGGLGAGHVRARLRAQRPRAGALDLPAARGGRAGHGRRAPAAPTPGLGRHVARVAGAAPDVLRRLARPSSTHEDADTAAAVVKVLGTTTEGDIADYVDTLTATGWAQDEELYTLLHAAILQRPGFTLRGGTNEILRGVIARGLGMR